MAAEIFSEFGAVSSPPPVPVGQRAMGDDYHPSEQEQAKQLESSLAAMEVDAAPWKPPVRTDAEILAKPNQWKQCSWFSPDDELTTAWVVDGDDPLLKKAVVTAAGQLYYQSKLVPDTVASELKSIGVVKMVVSVATSIFTQTQYCNRKTHEMGEKVSREQGAGVKPMQFKVKPPREWGGGADRQSKKKAAIDLNVWLMEVKDYMRLANVPSEIQADVACTYLCSMAQRLYNNRRATESQAQGFEHTMHYFEDTLRDLFVPRAQKAILVKDFTDRQWVPSFDENWCIQAQLQAFEKELVTLKGESVPELPEFWKVQLMLTSLPIPVFEEFKLAENGVVHSKWEELTAMLSDREAQGMSLYKQWLSKMQGQSVGSKRGRESNVSFEQARAPAAVMGAMGKGEGSGPATPRVSSGGFAGNAQSYGSMQAGQPFGGFASGASGAGGPSGPASGGASGAGGPRGSRPDGEKSAFSCFVCKDAGHPVSKCPFKGTNVNEKVGEVNFLPNGDKMPVNKKLQAAVRANPLAYLMQDGTVNVHKFGAEGGIMGLRVFAHERGKPNGKGRPQ